LYATTTSRDCGRDRRKKRGRESFSEKTPDPFSSQIDDEIAEAVRRGPVVQQRLDNYRANQGPYSILFGKNSRLRQIPGAFESYKSGGPPSVRGAWTRPLQVFFGGENEVVLRGAVPSEAVMSWRKMLALNGLKYGGRAAQIGGTVLTVKNLTDAAAESRKTGSPRPILYTAGEESSTWGGGTLAGTGTVTILAAIGVEGTPAVIIAIPIAIAGSVGAEAIYGRSLGEVIREFPEDPIEVLKDAKEVMEVTGAGSTLDT